MNKISFKQKIISAFLIVGLIPLSILAFLTLSQATSVAKNITISKLQAITETKKNHVEDYFGSINSQIKTFTTNGMIVDAMKAFPPAVKTLGETSNIQVDLGKFKGRYHYQKDNTPGATSSNMSQWMDMDDTAKIMQHLYISNNSHKIGAKEELDNANDGSEYSKLHEKYHPAIRQYLQEFGYYDIFLVNPEDGRIVYSVFKEVDYGTSLTTGPYSNTNFARVAQKALASNNRDAFFIEDFEDYEPSYGAPASFIASPIYEGDKKIGVAVFQMPVDRINEIMSNLGDDKAKTLQAYLLGKDMKMRSDSVLTHENTLGKEIHSSLLDEVFDHADGFERGKSYNGEKVFMFHKRIELEGFDWVIISEAEEKEILASVHNLQYIVLGISLFFLVIVVVIGLFGASMIAKPVQTLCDQFTSLIQNVKNHSNTIRSATEGMVAAAEETSQQSVIVKQNSQKSAENAGSVASAVQEMDASISQINGSVDETSKRVEDAVQKTSETSEVIQDLGETSDKIAGVLSVINDIADQTNLLALNAAIEAARAGDAGRGFAVVADEVKKLAGNTSQATEEIAEQITNIQSVSQSSVNAASQIKEAVEGIQQNAQAVQSAVSEQSGATQEISQRITETVEQIDQVDKNMEGIEEATNDTSIAANEVMSSVTTLESDFENMQTEIAGVLKKMGL